MTGPLFANNELMNISRIKFFLLVGGLICTVFVFSFLIYFRGGGGVSSDAAGYHEMAESVMMGRGIVDPRNPGFSEREPVYPLFVGGLYALFGAKYWVGMLAQSLLLMLVLTWLGWKLTPVFGTRGAAAIPVLTALVPGVASTAVGNLLPETLALVLCTAAAAVFFSFKNIRLRFGVTGLLLGLLGLTRFPFLLFPVFLGGFLFVKLRNKNKKDWPLRAVMLLMLGFLLPVFFWTCRNYLVYGILSPTGSKGGNEVLVRADKVRFEGEDLRAYLFGAFAGDYLARIFYPRYAERIEPYTYGNHIRYPYSAQMQSEPDPAAVSRQAVVEGLRLMQEHPVRYVTDGIAEFFKFNSPMVWHNSADIRHLFAGTHPELPSWIKALFLILYQGIFYGIIGISLIMVFSKGFSHPLLFLPALVILFGNAVYVFFDVYARYAMPLYAFYMVFFIMGIQHIFRSIFKNAERNGTIPYASK